MNTRFRTHSRTQFRFYCLQFLFQNKRAPPFKIQQFPLFSNILSKLLAYKYWFFANLFIRLLHAPLTKNFNLFVPTKPLQSLLETLHSPTNPLQLSHDNIFRILTWPDTIFNNFGPPPCDSTTNCSWWPFCNFKSTSFLFPSKSHLTTLEPILYTTM